MAGVTVNELLPSKAAYAAPAAGEAAIPYIFKGNPLRTTDFIETAPDITAAFTVPPEVNEPGWHYAGILLADADGNTTQINSRFFVYDIAPEFTVEAGTDPTKPVSEKDFISNFISAPSFNYSISGGPPDYSVIGEYPVLFTSGRFSASSVLRVTDTTPPAALIQNRHAYEGKPLDAKAFFAEIADISPVTATYYKPPDFYKLGTQAVYVLLQDKYYNHQVFHAFLTVVRDVTPPVISGLLDKNIVEGGTAAYRTGITVTDDYDTAPSLTVDSSRVNLKQQGRYPVFYTAADASGNTAAAEGVVSVISADMALVNDLADEILAQITDTGMSQRERARAIFDWVAQKVKYNGGISPREVADGAYACFVKGTGDCFVYKAGAQVLLSRAGIEHRDIRRHNGKTEHYWLLVNTGDGWYHFDASANTRVSDDERFMFTDTQAKAYTQRIGNGRRYYEYDPSTVPDVTD
jgi:transglutaminase-like putative cysteine protease